MYKIILFGTGKSSIMIESGLNEEVEIICYLDNDKNKWNKILNGKNILNPDNIKNMDYDYVIIASQFNDPIYEQLLSLEVEKDKIFQFHKYIDYMRNYIRLELKMLKSVSPDVIATGISYMQKAIKDSIICKKFFNLANASQDINFDYKLIKHILNTSTYNLSQLKYIFIGLSYYSFEYDLAKSSLKSKVNLYNDCMQNDVIIKADYYNNEIDYNISRHIFKFNEENKMIINWFNDNMFNPIPVNEEFGEKQAAIDGNKNYPETVKENTLRLKRYLQLLKVNNVKPIVIVCPVSQYYSKYFSNRIKEEFYNIIEEIRKEYKFQLLDYFDCSLFKDEDFYDVSHLNDKGAEKFTHILNDKVNW